MKQSRKDEPKRTERSGWANWLKEEGVGVARQDDQCKDPDYRAARSRDQNFAQSREGRIYPVSAKTRRKSACAADQDR